MTLVALLSAPAAAELGEVSFAPKFLVNWSDLSDYPTTGDLFGLGAGLGFDFPVNDRIIISPEILWIEKGGEVGGKDVRLQYIQVPILFWWWQEGTGPRPGAYVGPGLAFLIDDDALPVTADADNFEFSVMFGIGFQAGGFRGELRYDVGITDIGAGARNRTFSIVTGWYF
jgi:hypothetical protein